METIEHWLIEGKRDPQLKRWVVDLIFQEGSPSDKTKPCFVVYLDEEFSIQWYFLPTAIASNDLKSDQPNEPQAVTTNTQTVEATVLMPDQPNQPQAATNNPQTVAETKQVVVRNSYADFRYANSPSKAECFPNDFNLILNDIVHLETLSNNLRQPSPKWYHPIRIFFKSWAEFDRGRHIDEGTCDFSKMRRRHSQLRSTRRLIAEALGRTYEWIHVDSGAQDPRSIAARSAILTAQNFLKARSNDLGRSYLLSGALWASAVCLILAMVFSVIYSYNYDGKREQALRDLEFSAVKIITDISLPVDEMKKTFPQAEAIIDSLAAQKAAIDSNSKQLYDREKKIKTEKSEVTALRDDLQKLSNKLSASSQKEIEDNFSNLSQKIDMFMREEPIAKTSSWLNRDCWDLLMFSLTGAFGAMLSLLMSASKRDYDMGAGRLIHNLEGVTRIIVGVLGAGFITIAIKSGFILGFMTKESAASFSSSVTDPTRMMWLHYLFAFIAGVSERFVPSFISVVEAQTQSTKP